MTAVYMVLIVAGLLAVAAAVLVCVHTVAEARHPLPPAVPLVPFDAPEDEQPTLGVPVEVARRAVAEAYKRAAPVPPRASVRLLDPARAGWLFTDRDYAGVTARGWSR